MTDPLLDVSIVGGPLLIGLYVVSAAVLVVLLVRRRSTRNALLTGVAVLLAALAGWVLAWLVSDVWNVYGVSFSTVTRLWVSAFAAGLALAISNLLHSRVWRKTIAIIAIPLFLLTAAAGINTDFGAFTTVRAALGLTHYPALDTSVVAHPDLRHGTIGTVTIPATISGFDARDAVVYLPPVARLAHPPVLPVLEMMTGQPGSPIDLFTSGHMGTALDDYAAAHDGYAPIVVVPDQLGSPEKNPMCLDSPLGNSATYLTQDVPNWIRAHFRVATTSGGWGIGGFSQGATCSLQLGAAHPEIYGTMFPISSELVPQQGSLANTIKVGFGGDAAAYTAATPAAILAAHAPYRDMAAIFAVGENDPRYLPWAKLLAAEASRAGVRTQLLISPGTSHDWHTVTWALQNGLPLVAAELGLGGR